MAVAREMLLLPNRFRVRATRSVRRARVAATDAIAGRAREIASRTRSRHLFVLDTIGILLAAVLALALWLDNLGGSVSIGTYLWVAGILVSARVVMDISLGLYGHSWRHASIADMVRIIGCVAAGTGFAMIIVFGVVALQPPGVAAAPALSFWLMEMFFALVVLAVPRFSIRMVTDTWTRNGGVRRVRGEPTLLYGAGWAGVIVARSATRRGTSAVVPVGFLDDDTDLKGRRVAGLHVYGDRSALSDAVRETKATTLLITMPNASGAAVRGVVEAALEQRLTVRTVPPMTDLLDGTVDTNRIRSIRVEDLLRRPLAEEHASVVHDVFEGSTVAITGAAGSIGSELARQVLAVNPRRIALIDQAESPLYLLQRDLQETTAHRPQHGAGPNPKTPPKLEVTAHLVDVCEESAMTNLFEEVRPDVVLHAAAYKHVPMLEDYPSKAIRTNVGGTLSVIDAAAAAKVKRFVLVSTDKAVWPSSVMGAAKRVAEMIVAEAADRLAQPYISVRFGNVLGSSGSVVPIFQNQLEKGQPLTITDADMTRYFMTIPEAAWLILDAAAMADRGGMYVLDMGQPVRIMDVARDLIRLSGRDPDSVPIEITGLRKGEKLHEELFYDEESAHPTGVSKVLRADLPPTRHSIRDEIPALMALATGESDDELKARLHEYVRESVSREEEAWSTGERPVPKKAAIHPVVPDVVALRIHADRPTNGNGSVSRGTNGSTPVSEHDREALLQQH